MGIRNKILATVFLEDDCKQEDGEVWRSWRPINFDIYSELFPEMISEAIDEWLSVNTLLVNQSHELILAHCVERDAGGAVMGECFEVVYHEVQSV